MILISYIFLLRQPSPKKSDWLIMIVWLISKARLEWWILVNIIIITNVYWALTNNNPLLKHCLVLELELFVSKLDSSTLAWKFPSFALLFLIGHTFYSLYQWSPTFWAPGTGFMEDNFSVDGRAGGMVLSWIKPIMFIVHSISICLCLSCLYFYYYCISSTSDQQVLGPRVWRPLP